MEELVRTVSAKAGISEDQARQAVQTVVGFLKDRLPGPIGSQLDSVVGGGGEGGGGGLSGLGGKLG